MSEPTFDYDESSASTTGPQIRRSLEGKFVCPFCGSVNHRTDEPCPRCGMDNTPATRNSTRSRIGPWYVLQKRNPSAPGMKFDVLVKFIAKGRITPRTIVRGPTTTQLWRFAATIKGLSREFGLCYNCGGDVDRNTINCPQCGRDQQPPIDPDVLIESRSAAAASTSARNEPATDMFADQPIAGAAMDEPPVQGRRAVDPDADFVVERPTPRRTPPKPAAVEPEPLKPEPEPIKPKPSPFTAQPVKTTMGTAPQPSATAQRDERERREIEEARLAREAEPRDPNKPAPILSARELATAFQLDFNDGNKRRRTGRRGGKKLVVLLALALIGGGGVYAYKTVPAFKLGVDGAYATASAKVKTWIASATADKPTTATNQPSPPTKIEPGPGMPGRSVLENPTPPVQLPDVPPVVEQKPADEPPPVKVADVPLPPMSREEAYAMERKLWSAAMEAESKNDWHAAVAAYEQIQKLPKEVHRSILPRRLSEARERQGR